MLKYNLFGQTVIFEDAAERYFDLQFAAEQAGLNVSQRFQEWYKQCGNIQSVLDGYLQFSESAIERLAFLPLYGQLTGCEIYDISEESYWKRCIGFGESESALETVERQYNAILKRQNAKKEYRADRKAGRRHYVSYTSFHSDYWLRNQAEAGMKNLASFAGHTLWNTVGNAGSALSASMDKSTLYKNSATQDTLLNGIIADLFTAYFAHMDFLNERNENYVQSIYDEGKSSALFENAKKLPEKEHELLIQAFTLCPWNEALIKYIFIRFPEERKTIHTAAQRFSIDLRDSVEDILAQEYNRAAQSSEAAAQAAKERILNHMREYGVSESATLDKLETDCLRRLCEGYQAADESTCEQLIEKVRQYQAQEKLKGPFFTQLRKRIECIWTSELEQICQGVNTADEASCNLLAEKITQHKAPEDMKTPFLQKVRQRIQTIWTEELTEICQGAETSDEAACEGFLAAIKAHKAPEDMKRPFLRKVSQRIQTIWTEELVKICQGAETADEAACRQRLSAINAHKAPDSLKAAYVEAMEKRIQSIWKEELAQCCSGYETADEAACEGFLAAIRAHKAPDGLKASFLRKVQDRIESIWSAEDGEIFDNIYLKTDITNSEAIADAVAYMQSKDRTGSSKKYINALNACTPQNIKSARMYKCTGLYKLYNLLALFFIIAGGLTSDLSDIVTGVFGILAIAFFILAWKMKKAWKTLSVSGTILHPALLSKPPKTKKGA